MKVFLLLLVAFLAVSCGEENYSGVWSYESDETSFTLDLKQNGKEVVGTHSSVMLGGSRIDDSMDEESVKGTVTDEGLVVSIKSGYGLGTGKAKLTFVGQDSIRFKFVTLPKGEFWIPRDVIMVREK